MQNKNKENQILQHNYKKYRNTKTYNNFGKIQMVQELLQKHVQKIPEYARNKENTKIQNCNNYNKYTKNIQQI